MTIALTLAAFGVPNAGCWYVFGSKTPKVDDTPWKDRYAVVKAQHDKELAELRSVIERNASYWDEFEAILNNSMKPKEVKRLALEIKTHTPVGSIVQSLKNELKELDSEATYEVTAVLSWDNEATKKRDTSALVLKCSGAQVVKDITEHIQTRGALAEYMTYAAEFTLHGKGLKWKNPSVPVLCDIKAYSVEIIYEPVVVKVPVVEYKIVEVERVIFLEETEASKPVDKDYIAALVEVALNEQLTKKAAGSRIAQ